MFYSWFQTAYTPQALVESARSPCLRCIPTQSLTLASFKQPPPSRKVSRNFTPPSKSKPTSDPNPHGTLSSSPLRNNFQGVWSSLCPSPSACLPLPALYPSRPPCVNYINAPPLPGVGRSQGTYFPASSLWHHGGLTVSLITEIQGQSIEHLHATLPSGFI